MGLEEEKMQKEGVMDEFISWRRQEDGRSRTQVGCLALSRETPHPLRLLWGRQGESGWGEAQG